MTASGADCGSAALGSFAHAQDDGGGILPGAMIPDPPHLSYWEASPHLQRLCRRKLGDAAWRVAEPRLASMGERASLEVAPLAQIADREGPRLVDVRVEYHQAYRQMQKIAYGSCIIVMKYPPTPETTLVSFALGYLFA